MNSLGRVLGRVLSWLILSLILLGCAAQEQVNLALSPTRASTAIPLTTESPSVQLREPTITPTAKATYTPSPSSTPDPSPTWTPTASPTLSPTPEYCQSEGQIITENFNSLIAGGTQSLRLYLPPCYGEDGNNYPALYMLHGSASTDSYWDDLGLDEAAEALILSGNAPPFVIVMPDGGWISQNSSGGPNSFEGLILNELIPFVENNYCVWPERQGRALGGVSRGAYWSLEIAFRNPSFFASAGAHSAALLDTFAGPNLNPQYTGISNDLGDLRIYMDTGDSDWYINQFRQLHIDMEDAGKPHTWIINEGTHEDSYWTVHQSEYLEWYTQPWSLDRESYSSCPLR